MLNRVVIFFSVILIAASCKTIDIFEKNVTIPDHSWDRSFKPVIKFNINDTTVLYNIYISLRHTHAYEYNNIWVNVGYEMPGDTLKTQRVDVLLADNQKGWLGTGMDDIYEVRKLISPQPYKFQHAGEYTFTLEQIMRDNPLKEIMNVGIRVEKAVH